MITLLKGLLGHSITCDHVPPFAPVILLLPAVPFSFSLLISYSATILYRSLLLCCHIIIFYLYIILQNTFPFSPSFFTLFYVVSSSSYYSHFLFFFLFVTTLRHNLVFAPSHFSSLSFQRISTISYSFYLDIYSKLCLPSFSFLLFLSYSLP